jgi:hypothetical protein
MRDTRIYNLISMCYAGCIETYHNLNIHTISINMKYTI